MTQNLAIYDVGLYDTARYDTLEFNVTIGINISLLENIILKLVYPKLSIFSQTPSGKVDTDTPDINVIDNSDIRMSVVNDRANMKIYSSVPKISL